MSKGDLSEQEWEALDHARFGTTEAQVCRNAPIILRTAVGRAKAGIAQDLGCSPATVDNVRQRYRQQGLAGLRRRRSPGRRSRATAVRRALQTPPGQFGYGFSVWSVTRVGQPLKKTTGWGSARIPCGAWCTPKAFPFNGPNPRSRANGTRRPTRPHGRSCRT